ncbi:MAG: DUF104 domain-containing protein [Armatimonadetes bacterium]|nr:DUF104 domain-containing protein [Armatimonadota bacterium]
MTATITAVFDGEVLRPLSADGLERGRRYTIRLEEPAPEERPMTAWEVLEKYRGTVVGPPDFSAEHDKYLTGEADLELADRQ